MPRSDILVETGRVLRQVREARGLTLRRVGVLSGGRFTPTGVAGYERAERSISLERFCELARLYGVDPERLLSVVMWRIAGGPTPRIDSAKVSDLPPTEQQTVGGFIRHVRALRDQPDDSDVAVRVRDLEVLATVSGQRLEDFLQHLRPALALEPQS